METVEYPRGVLPLVGFAMLVSSVAAVAGSQAKTNVELARDVRAIFERNCFKCHGAKEEEGGLRLDLRQRVLKGGTSGPALVPGKPAESLIYQFVTGENDDKIIMPPKGRGQRLSEADCETLRSWIEAGAPWPDDAMQCPHPPESQASDCPGPCPSLAFRASVRGRWRRLR
jgi:mono/diheme cytochrome c family protein